jgi:hypothetical protein
MASRQLIDAVHTRAYTELTNGHNSVTVQNRTHVYMSFFDHKDLGNHLLQLCPKVAKHPVYIYIHTMSGFRNYSFVWVVLKCVFFDWSSDGIIINLLPPELLL